MIMKLRLPLAIMAVVLATVTIARPETKKQNDKEPEKDKGKPFETIIKDYQKIEGLFTFYVKADEGKVYMEIKPDQLDVEYLCSMTRSAGDGTYYDNGADRGDFPYFFKRVGTKIYMMQKNLRYRADPASPLARAIDRGVSNSIFGVAKIESLPQAETKALLVDPTGFFIQDISNTGYFLGKERKLEYSFDKDNSYLGEIKSFPFNSEIDAIYHFKTAKPNDAETFPSPYSMLHTYHFSLSTLPKTDYRPRLADDRVGYFQTLYQDYSRLDTETPYVRYISRWFLEKAYPDSQLSPPKEPIVFWLENTIPDEYRPYVTQGVLLWNKAFEKVGFKDAIVVKQMPDTASWDPADVRYNTVRWVIYPGQTYAVGPSRTNPYTGQIYDADIRVCVDFIRWMYIYSEYFVDPIAETKGNSSQWHDGFTDQRYYCNYGEESAKDAAFAMSLLDARSDFDDQSEVTKEFVRSYIVDLVCHEVGHTLGLRHNFKASIIHTNQERNNRAITESMGITASVMDYNPANIAPPGVEQGEYWHSTPGTYDFWAIEYGYRPIAAASIEGEKAELGKIAGRCADPLLPYGTDEDVFGNSMVGIDPMCSQRDLSDDPIAFYRDEIALAQELWSKLEEKFEVPGNRYQKLMAAFDRGWRPYFYASSLMPKFIGGIYHNNYHVGDAPGTLPFEPVPAVRQKEAMEFLKKHIFAADAFAFPASLLNKLQLERLEDFNYTAGKVKRVDYPIHDRVFAYQKSAVDRIFDPIALSRMQDSELRSGPADTKYTMADVFTDLRRAIWTEVVTKENINSFRRRLQRYHLDKVIGMAVEDQEGIPEDARTLARNDLKVLQGAIPAALAASTLDLYTRGHLEESRARIEAALDAGLQRKMQAAAKKPE